jgi:hypothetical protein
MQYRVEQLMVSNKSFPDEKSWGEHMIMAWGKENAQEYLKFINEIDHRSESTLMLDGYAVYKLWYFNTREDAEYFVSQKEGKWREIMMSTGECVFSYGPLQVTEI